MACRAGADRHLLSSAIKASEEQAPMSEQAKSSEDKQKPAAKTARKTSHGKNVEAPSKEGLEKETQATEKAATRKSEIQEAQPVDANANRNEESNRASKNPDHAANSDPRQDAPNGKVA